MSGPIARGFTERGVPAASLRPSADNDRDAVGAVGADGSGGADGDGDDVPARPCGSRRRPGRFTAWLLFLLLFLPWLSVLGAAGSAGREAMADAMSRMMEAMGLLGSGGEAARAMTNGGVPGMSPVPGMPLDQAGEVGRQLMEGMASRGAGRMPWTGAALGGVWESAGGGLLIVEGSYYRLYAPNWAFVDGTLQVTGDRLRMASRRAGFSLEFEFALDQGRLALRDAQGQVLLYRRLVLDGGG
jgi:hypothetical protein